MKLIGKRPWERNPAVCCPCSRWLRKKGEGGAEVELSLVFADVRGSTSLAEKMTPKEYGRLINRFFTAATDVLVRCGGIIDQLVGDEVIGLFLPGYAGQDHTRRAIEAGCMLLEATGHGGGGDPWLPVGIGVHRGIAFVGSVGSAGAFTDFTALGDAVNTTARLASAARPGEVLVSEVACRHGGLDPAQLERRLLELKGKSEAVAVVALRGRPGLAGSEGLRT